MSLHQDGPGRRPQRGIPDGLLMGLLAFVLGLTVLVWTATGLAGLLSHGGWPHAVTFGRTPPALRQLVEQPHDVPAAWPDTPPGELSGPGLFWGLLIGQLMVLTVLTVFVLGVLTRWRAVRARRREQHRHERAAAAARRAPAGAAPVRGTEVTEAGRPQAPAAGTPGIATTVTGTSVPGPAGTGTAGTRFTVPATPVTATPVTATPLEAQPWTTTGPAGSVPASSAPPGHGAAHRPQVADPTGPRPVSPPAPASPPAPGTVPAPFPSATETAVSPSGPLGAGTTAIPSAVGLGPASSPTAPHQPPPAPSVEAAAPFAVPAPRTERRVQYGDPHARRPAAVQAIREAEGPALVVTSDPAVWAETKDARAKLGPVLVYDPGHLCDTPARLHWSPTAGCQNADTAAARAIALLAPVRPRALLDAAMADTAETLLRCWLHAAAVDARPFRQVHRWAQGGSAHEAVRILRTHPRATSGLAGLLESALTAHPERREVSQQLTARALSALSSVHIREACTPNRTDALALASFVDEGGTLYVVGEAIEDPRSRPGAMPLLTALTSSVVEHGRRMAARSSDGRLDPPLTLVLDDVAAVAPLPALPALLTTGHDRGMPTLALLRSREQGRDRWPRHELPAQDV